MKLYKLILFLFLLPAIIFANDKKKHEKSKTISKNFTVNKNATLYVNNKYGDLNITTWNENRIEIEVKITVKGDDLSSVDKKLNAINISFESTNNLVEARTRIEKTTSSWSFWNNNSVNYKINYFIKMPITNNADLNNKYGSIELDKLEGKANLNCDYGNINVDELLNDTNSINLDYCGSSEINFIKSGSVNVDYSKLKIEKTNILDVNTDYSTITINEIGDLKFNSDYGSLSVNNVTNIEGSSDYTGVKIGTLLKNLKIDTDFGSVKIKDIAIGFETINIDGSYAGIKLGTSSKNNFNFKLNLSYAGFNYPKNNTNFNKSIKKNTKKYYEGSFGTNNSKSNIIINSKYGGVSLKTND